MGEDLEPKYFVNDGYGMGEEMSEREFKFWYIFNHAQANENTVNLIIKRLESGKVMHLADGATVQRTDVYSLDIIEEETPPPIKTSMICEHKDTYINYAGGVDFLFCRDCKEDLGDVECSK